MVFFQIFEPQLHPERIYEYKLNRTCLNHRKNGEMESVNMTMQTLNCEEYSIFFCWAPLRADTRKGHTADSWILKYKGITRLDFEH